jgi:hypothetical protein
VRRWTSAHLARECFGAGQQVGFRPVAGCEGTIIVETWNRGQLASGPGKAPLSAIDVILAVDALEPGQFDAVARHAV